MKCKVILLGLFFSLSWNGFGQDLRRKNYFPIWSFHQKNANIHGISIGLFNWNGEQNTYTNGIRLELIG